MIKLIATVITLAIFTCEAATAQPDQVQERQAPFNKEPLPSPKYGTPAVEKPMPQGALERMYSTAMVFNSEKWKTNRGLQYSMAPLLEQSGQLLGMTKNEVHSLLGESDISRSTDKADRETYSLPVVGCGNASKRSLELDYNSYDQVYSSRIVILLDPGSFSPVYEVTPFHAFDYSPNSGWKVITVDTPPIARRRIRIPANKIIAE